MLIPTELLKDGYLFVLEREEGRLAYKRFYERVLVIVSEGSGNPSKEGHITISVFAVMECGTNAPQYEKGDQVQVAIADLRLLNEGDLTALATVH